MIENSLTAKKALPASDAFREEKKKCAIRKFCKNHKVSRVVEGRTNNFGYKSNTISHARGGIWRGGVHYGKSAAAGSNEKFSAKRD